jgi:hypothetical protein
MLCETPRALPLSLLVSLIASRAVDKIVFISCNFNLCCSDLRKCSVGRSILGKHSPPQALFVALLQCVRRRTAHQGAVLSSPSLTSASHDNTLCSPLWHRYQTIPCHHQHEASPACSGSQLQTQFNAGNWYCTDADRDLVLCANVVLPQVLQADGFHSIGFNVCGIVWSFFEFVGVCFVGVHMSPRDALGFGVGEWKEEAL